MHLAVLQSCFLSLYWGERSGLSPLYTRHNASQWEENDFLEATTTPKTKKGLKYSCSDYDPLLLLICDFYTILSNTKANTSQPFGFTPPWLPVCVHDSRVLKVKIYIFQFTHLFFYTFKQIIPTLAFKFVTTKRSVADDRTNNGPPGCKQRAKFTGFFFFFGILTITFSNYWISFALKLRRKDRKWL